MATVTTVLPTDTEAGDLVNLSHAVIIDTNMLEIPDAFLSLARDAEQHDTHVACLYVADGWVLVDAYSAIPYGGSIYEIEPQYA